MNNRSTDREISLGRFGKPFGLKGYIYFRYYGDDLETLAKYKGLLISDSLFSVEIENLLKHGQKLTVKIIGIDNRDDAEKFRGKELLILEKDLPSTKLEEYYLFELENLKVVNEENELLGRIDQIMKTGANDVLVVKPSSKSVDRIERLVPFTKREVVKEVDLKSKVVYVKWPKDY